jgi:hypothetical protein
MKKIILLIFICFESGFIYSQEEKKTEFQLPKKSGFITPTFNLNHSSGTNFKTLGVQFDDEYRLDYSLNFNWGYFLKKDFSIGLQVSYNNKRINLKYYPDGVYTESNYFANLVSLIPNIRNYFGAGRFKAFAQTNLGFTFGKGLERIYTEENDDKIDSKYYALSIAVQPGVAIFVADFVTLEVSINLIGLTSTYEESTLNNTSESIRTSNSVDFNINLLTMNIGLGFYFNTKKYSVPTDN